MKPCDLTEDLVAVERLLTGHAALEAIDEFSTGAVAHVRGRVLRSIQTMRTSQLQSTGATTGGTFAFVAGLAAVVAIVANLSYSVFSQGVSLEARADSAQLQRQAELLREILPQLTIAESRSHIARIDTGLRTQPPRLPGTTRFLPE